MADKLVLVEHVDGVAVISYNRPERHNASNDEMGAQTGPIIAQAIDDPNVRCILLRGEGKSFSSGRDTSQLGHRVGGESDISFVRRAQQGRQRLMNAPKPVIAALKGYCLGGGLEGALAADIRVGDTTTVMAFPEIKYGLMADTGGTMMALQLAGPSRAKYLHMTGERIDAKTAYEWGLIDFLVEPEELDEFALAMAKKIAAQSTTAIAMIKQTIDSAFAGQMQAGLSMELFGQVALFSSDEQKQRKAAALEKAAAEKSNK